MLRRILIVVAILVAIPALAALIGLFLPKGHVATSRATYSQAPETIWAVVVEFERWPEWNASVQKMERGPDRDGKPVWLSIGKWGQMPSVIEVFEPPRRLVTRIPEDAGIGFSGSWIYEIAPAGGGATLTITERGEVSNPLFRFMGLFFFDAHSTMHGFMRALGGKFGEKVEPAPVP